MACRLKAAWSSLGYYRDSNRFAFFLQDLIIFNTKRDTAARRDASISILAMAQSTTDPNTGPGGRVGLAMADVESLISTVLSSDSSLQLGILTEAEMASALQQFVGRSDNDAIGFVVDKVITETRGHLTQQWCLEDRVPFEVTQFAKSRRKATASSGVVESRGAHFLKRICYHFIGPSKQYNVIPDLVIDTSPIKEKV